MVHTVIWPASQCSPSFTTALPGEVVVGLRGPFWLVINQGSASDFGRRLEVLRFRAHRFASPHGRPIACEWDDTDRIIEAPVLVGVPFDASALWMRALMGRSGWLPQLGGLGPEHMRTGWIVSIQRGGANVFRAPATLGGGRLCNLLAPQASQGPNPLLSRRPGPIRLVPGMGRALMSLYTARMGSEGADVGTDRYEWLNVLGLHLGTRWQVWGRTRHLSRYEGGYWKRTEAGFPHPVVVYLNDRGALTVDGPTSFAVFEVNGTSAAWLLSNVADVDFMRSLPARSHEGYAQAVVRYEPACGPHELGSLHWLNALGGWETSLLEFVAQSAVPTQGSSIGRLAHPQVGHADYRLDPRADAQRAWPHDAVEQRLRARIWAPTRAERLWLGELCTTPLAYFEPAQGGCYPLRITQAEQSLGGGDEDGPWVAVEGILQAGAEATTSHGGTFLHPAGPQGL